MKIADNHSRETIAINNSYREFNKQQAVENPKWVCPGCGTLNFARTWDRGNGLIVTPRAYCCHNSRCAWRMVYYRNGEELHRREVHPLHEVDVLGLVSPQDPIEVKHVI